MAEILVCWPCQNLKRFTQASARGDQRTVDVGPDGPILGPYQEPMYEEMPPGIYCRLCDAPVDLDSAAAAEFGLEDVRLDLLPPGDFLAEPFAESLKRLVPNAEWTEFAEAARAPPVRNPFA